METKYDKQSLNDLNMEAMDEEPFQSYTVEPPSEDAAVIRQNAIAKAARLLAFRSHSRQGLYRKLTQRGFPPPAVMAAIDRMEEIGVLDDQIYGRSLADRLIKKGYGPLRVEMELYKAGIERDLRDALVQALPPEGELAAAFLRKTCAPEDLLDEAYRRKLVGAMKRKGYGWSAVSESMREYERMAPEEREE
ncbi:MAG: regulatory protein RecX [Oscillospiraceae bacterium]|jgi:regulatory protein